MKYLILVSLFLVACGKETPKTNDIIPASGGTKADLVQGLWGHAGDNRYFDFKENGTVDYRTSSGVIYSGNYSVEGSTVTFQVTVTETGNLWECVGSFSKDVIQCEGLRPWYQNLTN